MGNWCSSPSDSSSLYLPVPPSASTRTTNVARYQVAYLVPQVIQLPHGSQLAIPFASVAHEYNMMVPTGYQRDPSFLMHPSGRTVPPAVRYANSDALHHENELYTALATYRSALCVLFREGDYDDLLRTLPCMVGQMPPSLIGTDVGYILTAARDALEDTLQRNAVLVSVLTALEKAVMRISNYMSDSVWLARQQAITDQVRHNMLRQSPEDDVADVHVFDPDEVAAAAQMDWDVAIEQIAVERKQKRLHVRAVELQAVASAGLTGLVDASC